MYVDSLQNWSLCRAVKTHAVINEVVDFKTLSGNLQKKISLIENEKFRLMARNVDLEREVATLRNEIKELKVNTSNTSIIVQQPQQQVTSSENKKWEERERELMAKFTNIIHCMQMEIAKQNMAVCINNLILFTHF